MIKNCSNCGAGVTAAPLYNKASSCENPPTQLRTVTIPKNKGGDGPTDPYAPKLGAWENTIVVYQKTGSVYLYDVNGVYTNLTGTDYASQILAMQENITQLQTNLTDTQTQLQTEVTNRVSGDTAIQAQVNALQSALATETEARTAGDTSISNQITGIQNQVNQIGNDLNSQTGELQQSVTALQEGLTQEANNRTEADAQLQNSITANSNAITALQSALGTEGGVLERELVVGVDASADFSTVNLGITKSALNTPDTTITEVALPVASSLQAGVLNAATYDSLISNASSIDSILNGAVALDNIPASPTQEELSDAWKAATGKEDLINRASIYDSANGKIWYYYTNTGEWASITSGDATVTVATATNSSLGIVMGSVAEGQIAIENNGTMSLNGWDAHVAQVADNTTQIAALNATIGTIQTTLTRLDSGAGV